MKESINVPLTKAQIKALRIVAEDYVEGGSGTPSYPALRNAVKRLKKANRPPQTDTVALGDPQPMNE